MQGIIGSAVAIIGIIIVGNFYFWRKRYLRDIRPVKRSTPESVSLELRHKELQRRFEREQEDAIEFIEKRRKTHELYDQVRRQAEATEKEAAPADADAL